MSEAKDRFTLSETLAIFDTIYVIPSNDEGSEKTYIAFEYIRSWMMKIKLPSRFLCMTMNQNFSRVHML